MESGQPPTALRLATYNIHLGVDGWGRPFDVVGECRALDADILIIQESWAPDGGDPSSAGLIADGLGYQVVAEVGMARGRLYEPMATSTDRWGPVVGLPPQSFHLDTERRGQRANWGDRSYVPGSWGLAMLSRIPTHDLAIIHLDQLRRDPARRLVMATTVEMEGGDLVVHGTHMSHITHGSHAQFRRLSRLLPPPTAAALLAGDMNLWGPPVTSYLRGWRRAVTAKTWPTHRPHSQLDHVLVTPPVRVVDARVSKASGSDHRPVVVTVSVGGDRP